MSSTFYIGVIAFNYFYYRQWKQVRNRIGLKGIQLHEKTYPYHSTVSRAFVNYESNGLVHIGSVSGLSEDGTYSLSFEDQSRAALRHLERVLTQCRSSPSLLLKVNVYLTDMNLFRVFNNIYKDFFPNQELTPARACISVKQLLHPYCLVQLDCVACLDIVEDPSICPLGDVTTRDDEIKKDYDERQRIIKATMERVTASESVLRPPVKGAGGHAHASSAATGLSKSDQFDMYMQPSSDASKPHGDTPPESQSEPGPSTLVADVVLAPEEGSPSPPPAVASSTETEQQSPSTPVQDENQPEEVNQEPTQGVVAQSVVSSTPPPPAAEAVQQSSVQPYLPESPHECKLSPIVYINTDGAPQPVGPYSQCTIHKPSGTVYISGCIGIDPSTNEFPPIHDEHRHQVKQYVHLEAIDIDEDDNKIMIQNKKLRQLELYTHVYLQTKQSFNNLFAIASAAGVNKFTGIVKFTLLVTRSSFIPIIRDILYKLYPKHDLSCLSIIVASSLPLNALVEVEAIGVVHQFNNLDVIREVLRPPALPTGLYNEQFSQYKSYKIDKQHQNTASRAIFPTLRAQRNCMNHHLANNSYYNYVSNYFVDEIYATRYDITKHLQIGVPATLSSIKKILKQHQHVSPTSLQGLISSLNPFQSFISSYRITYPPEIVHHIRTRLILLFKQQQQLNYFPRSIGPYLRSDSPTAEEQELFDRAYKSDIEMMHQYQKSIRNLRLQEKQDKLHLSSPQQSQVMGMRLDDDDDDDDGDDAVLPPVPSSVPPTTDDNDEESEDDQQQVLLQSLEDPTAVHPSDYMRFEHPGRLISFVEQQWEKPFLVSKDITRSFDQTGIRCTPFTVTAIDNKVKYAVTHQHQLYNSLVSQIRSLVGCTHPIPIQGTLYSSSILGMKLVPLIEAIRLHLDAFDRVAVVVKVNVQTTDPKILRGLDNLDYFTLDNSFVEPTLTAFVVDELPGDYVIQLDYIAQFR